jgi:hypothetical protein
MQAIMLVLILISTSGHTETMEIGPFMDRRECAEAAVRLTEVARRNGLTADGACIGVGKM